MTSRLCTARVAVGVLLLLAPASPARAFDYDTHYLWTYYLALQVGYTPRQAYQIASATFAVDHDKETGPLEATAFEAIRNAPLPKTETVWTRFHAFADARYASLRELTPGGTIEFFTRVVTDLQNRGTLRSILKPPPDIELAALDGDPAMVQELRENNRKDLWALALETGNPGLYLHYIQDIHSHKDYDSRHGHLYASHAPDYMSYNVARSREMTTDTIKALQDFARDEGFATREVNMTRVWEVLDQLVATNPPVWAGQMKYYDELLAALVPASMDALSYMERAFLVPAGTTGRVSQELDRNMALSPKVSGIGSPKGPDAWSVVTEAIADDRRFDRLPTFPDTWFQQDVPPKWFQYDYDATGHVEHAAVNRDRFAVEWPEVVVGNAQVTCAPEPDTQSLMRVTLRVPYEIRGAASLDFQHPLPVYNRSIQTDSGEQKPGTLERENGHYEIVRYVLRPRASLNGSAKWTETIAVGPGNERAVVDVPLSCGQVPSPAQPPRLASPPPSPIACPVSSLGSGTWTLSPYGTVQNGSCFGGTCVVRCQYGQGPGSRSVGIIWDHKDASACSDFLGPRGWNLTRDLNPRGATEPEGSAERRDPEGKRLLDQLEAAVAPYAWKCPSAGSAPAGITKVSWLRPATPAGPVASLLALAGGQSVIATLAQTARGEVLRPPAPGPARIMFGGRTVDAVYEQNVDGSGKPIDIYFYQTVPPPGAPTPVGDQVWNKFVRSPAAAANSPEPVVWWHAHWEYGPNGWQYIQEQNVPPPQTPR